MPLSREETKGYVRHRLRVAGATEEIFTPGALLELHRLSSGIPRVINVACDRALLGAYTQETKKITASLVRRAAGEVYGRRFFPTWLGWVVGSLAIVALAGIAVPRLAILAPSESGASRIARDQKRRRDCTWCAAPRTAAAVPAAPAVAAPPRAQAGVGQCAARKPTKPTPPMQRPSAACWRCGGPRWPDDRDPCGQAAKAGLACLDQRGSWAQVKTLESPRHFDADG